MRSDSSAGNSEISRNESTCRSGMTSRCVSALGLMSRMATKPSEELTWSPSRKSWQKRQSSGSENPLLRDRSPKHGNELADLAAQEPRRVVVAVTAARSIDEDEILAADLRAPAFEAGEARLLAQAGAPLPLDLGLNRVRSRGDGARPRRVRKDVNLGDAGLRDHVEGPPEGGLV